jgi:hypothetical protein
MRLICALALRLPSEFFIVSSDRHSRIILVIMQEASHQLL